MKRTAFAVLLAVATFTSLAPVSASPSSELLAFVGTYTDKTSSKGIYSFRIDPYTGKISDLGLAAETTNPSFLAVHPSQPFLYAVNESGRDSKVSAFRIDPATGKLALLNQVSAYGEDPCYITLDRAGKYVFVANYSSGNVVVFPVAQDGKLGEPTANVRDEGKPGPSNAQRDGPHAHWIEPAYSFEQSPSAKQPGGHIGNVYVADLGLDRILPYQFDATNGTLSKAPTRSNWAPSVTFDPSAKLARGTGPRHAAFSERGLRMYVLGELQSTVTAFHMAGTDLFTPTVFQRISTLPKGFSGRNDAAEIALHRSGKFLYTSNRGNDTIAVFTVDPRGGRLKLEANVSTGGKEPRHFALDPTGNFLLAENQLSDNIVEFRIDPATGLLVRNGDTVNVPSPVCLVFGPIQ